MERLAGLVTEFDGRLDVTLLHVRLLVVTGWIGIQVCRHFGLSEVSLRHSWKASVGKRVSDGCVQRLIQIGDDIVAVLDSDAEADHLWPHAGCELLVG